MSVSKMLMGSPILMGDNNVPGVRIHKEVMDVMDTIFSECKDFGLDFYPTIVEFLTYDEISEIAAYGGFPVRYPHWRFGMEYEELSRGYEYGMHRISEMVVNNNPCYIYCLDSNTLVDNIDVIAHALGHNHFFKNNVFFKGTHTGMMNKLANHATRIRKYMARWGYERVTEFIDHCLRLDTLIDPMDNLYAKKINDVEFSDSRDYRTPHRQHATHNYMDNWINPVKYVEREKERIEKADAADYLDIFDKPVKNIFCYLKDHAPLKPWQQDIISMLYEEAMYFSPQRLTKMLNEGFACAKFDTLVLTNAGYMKIGDIVENKLNVFVHDGFEMKKVTNWFKHDRKKTATILTNRGYTISASVTHRVMDEKLVWKRLDELKVGDKLVLSHHNRVWPNSLQSISWKPRRLTKNLTEISHEHKVDRKKLSAAKKSGDFSKLTDSVSRDMKVYIEEIQYVKENANRQKKQINIPAQVNENLAEFLGYMIGDGHISVVGRELGLTSGDRYSIDRFVDLVRNLFNLNCEVSWDNTSLNGRWRASVNSIELEEFLVHLGLSTGECARNKVIPNCILQSPKSVVSAFLRSYFDCDAYGGKEGVILSSSSVKLIEQIQVIFLNYGITSNRFEKDKDNYHLMLTGLSAKLFYEEIGFGLERKQNSLQECIIRDGRRFFKPEVFIDEISEITYGEDDVYDITVDQTHRYVAQGFINHNSYTDYNIMCKHGLCGLGQKRHDMGIIQYAKHKMLVLGGKYSQNPYKLGFELLTDIEERWDKGRTGREYEECNDMRKRADWDTKMNKGKEKVFEVCEFYNDALAIAEFFTPDLCEKMEYFEYKKFNNGQTKIMGRDYESIKSSLVRRYMNGGLPDIRLTDPNHLGKGWFLMQHYGCGLPLYDPYAKETITSVYRIWGNTVVLATQNSDKEQFVYMCDGIDAEKDVHVMRRSDYEKEFVK